MHEGKRFVTERKTLFVRCAALLFPMVCALTLLSQTVFAQNTYVITDGSRVLVHTTYATDPATVLGEAGLELGEEDTYITQSGDGISEITVRRGQTDEIETASVYTTETYTQSIPHEITYCQDASLPTGTQKVLTKGEDGQMQCTARVIYSGTEEVSRTVLSRTVTQQPVKEVIAVGTGTAQAQAEDTPDAPVIGDGIIITPTGEVLTYTDVLDMLATAYTYTGNPTATGTVARVGEIAVDPTVIPYGTRMYIVSEDGEYVYGVATAEDCGGDIIGNRIDLYYDTESECWQFGARNCKVYILG